MPIPLNCSNCQQPLLAPDDRAGQPIRCPHCDALSAVPAPEVEDGAPVCDDENEVEEPPRPKWRPTRAPTEPLGRHEPPDQWLAFARGCRWIERGIAIEFVAVTLLLVVLSHAALANLKLIPPVRANGDHAALLFFVPLLLGTGLVAGGRFLVLGMPSGTGGLGVMLGAFLLSLVRFASVLGGLIFIILALNEGPGGGRGLFFEWAGRLYALALVSGLVAEVSSVAGMAIVAGAMPSARLRRRAGLVALMLQLIASAWVLLMVLVIYADLLADFTPRPPNPGPVPRAPIAPVAPAPPISKALVLLGGLSGLFVLQAAYAYLHYSLYAAGRGAGRTGGDRSPQPARAATPIADDRCD